MQLSCAQTSIACFCASIACSSLALAQAAPNPAASTSSAQTSSADSGTADATPGEQSATEARTAEAPASAPPPSEAPPEDRAPAPDEPSEAELKVWAAEQSPACSVRAHARVEGQVLLACGEAGLWRVKRDPSTQKLVLEARENRGGEVLGFARAQGELFVLVDLRTVQPLDGGTATFGLSPASAGAPSERQAGPGQAQGKVISGKGLRVIVEVDPSQHWSVGYRVAFVWADQRVVGRVAHVEGSLATVIIGMHEPRPPEGTTAEPTPERATSRMVAPRDGTWHYIFDLGTRIGLSVDGIFGGEGGIQMRFGNLSLSAEMRPFVASTQGVFAVQAFASMGVTTSLVGLSLGVGTSTVNRHATNPPGTGILITPALRIGAIDGLHVRSRASVALHRQEIQFTGLFFDVNVPVSRSLSIIARGGGGNLGLGEGDAGIRTLFHGNGGPKSWFFYVAGGATFVEEAVTFESDVAPHVRVGLETRL